MATPPRCARLAADYHGRVARSCYVVAFVGGIAGLTWELLWMHHAALALGVSAQGAALTLIAFSAGMAGGSLLAGRLLASRSLDALRMWAVLEIVLGLLGQALAPGFALVAAADAALWPSSIVQWLGVFAVLAVPAACMGATVPVFADVAARRDASIGLLYAANVGGAAVGVVLASFVVIPAAGISATTDLACCIDIVLGLVLLLMARRAAQDPASTPSRAPVDPPSRVSLVIAASTGFATFALEVAWFRSLRAAFQATTESFALVLFAVLVSLGIGGTLGARLQRGRRVSLAAVVATAAVLVLLGTPLVERADLFVLSLDHASYGAVVFGRLALAIVLLGPAMITIGIALPWCLQQHADPRSVARLYAVNTIGAVAGSLAAAWLALPAVGFARTSWLAALVLAGAATFAARPAARIKVLGAVAIAVLIAWLGASDVGKLRAQINGTMPHVVVATREGPDATVSVIQHDGDDARFLVIDGFHASGTGAGEHYMAWMGHLPMMLHDDPRTALVICFGTGQTANAVRREGPSHLDIVDVNQSVFAMHDLFPHNQGVLDDPRVDHHVMDGRAWLRRTDRRYDIITLEPMPPTFAGSNALYSLDFYELMITRLEPGGVVAQWLPFHLVDPEEAASITATFIAAFPDAVLWIDRSGTGILLGRARPPQGNPGWPGLARPVERGLSAEAIVRSVIAGAEGLRDYAAIGSVITDDNQRLSYGIGRERWWRQGRGIEDTIRWQLQLVEAMMRPGDPTAKLAAFVEAHPHPGAE